MNNNIKYLITDNALSWLETVLAERFGHIWHLSQINEELHLQLADHERAVIFDTLSDGFSEAKSDQPCTRWEAEREGWVSVLGNPLPAPCTSRLAKPLIEKRGTGYAIHYDILGLTYWMLARVEEIGRTDLDKHQRFPATSSHAYKNDYLEQPVVDEWLHILGQVIEKNWPEIEFKQHQFDMKVSHDVDYPSLYGFKSWPAIGRMIAGHLLKRHDLRAFASAPYFVLATRDPFKCADPFNTFDWLMDLSEAHNLQSAFYFICGRTNPVYDSDYDPDHPAIRGLMRKIHNRGHEIGLHPSYDTFQNPEILKQEAECLKRICAEEGIEQKHWGGRMHFLRWENPTTLYSWQNASMSYDSTQSYADRPGFRCGTCFEYPGFDPIKQVMLNLRIRPLIAMECTIIAQRYLGLGYSEQSMDKFMKLKESCSKVRGTYTLLWHNNHLTNEEDKEFYKTILATK